MRKINILMLIFSLILITFTACGDKDTGNTSANSSNVISKAPDEETEAISQSSANEEDVITQAPISQQKEETQGIAETSTNSSNETEENSTMSSTDKSIKEFEYLPTAYTLTDTNMGTIERLDYKTNTYDSNKRELDKYLNVYLPYGYDPNDKETKYNVFYLMHGGGENQNTIFGGPGKNKELMKILDNMIKNGDIAPLIVVTPTFYNEGNSNASQLTRDFHNELVNDIIPAVEGKYNTYAASTSKDDLKASRSHRAFGGFSMGGACTWYTYINCLDYFEYIMPLSGDCWALGDAAGRSKSTETAQLLAKVADESGYATDEYYVFCATGTDDVANDNMVPQIEAMKKLSDRFIYTADFTEGNFYFMVAKNGTHSWNYVNQYIYNILPYFFFK